MSEKCPDHARRNLACPICERAARAERESELAAVSGSPAVFSICDGCNEEFRLPLTGNNWAGYCCAGEQRCPQCGVINRLWIRISMPENARTEPPAK